MTNSAAASGVPFTGSNIAADVSIERLVPLWKRFLQVAGPGVMVSVGYMDPGNWATDIEAGSRYGYELLSVVLISSLAAMLLQALSVRLGLASGMDLARACRELYPAPVTRMLWVFGELSIAACDLAELLGSALALHLLLHVSLMAGLAITALDTFVVLWLGNMGFRRVEAIILALVLTISACYAIEMVLAQPDWAKVAGGLLPSRAIFSDPHQAFVAIGIVGATVMPHNLYLHSSVVLAKRDGTSAAGLRALLRFCMTDTVLSLTVAMLVNAAILVLAASTFHRTGHHDVTDLAEAYRMLDPLVGGTVASMLFAIALLASGQSATLTGTIAGQVILEGFLDLRIPVWQRRFITRVIAVVPAVAGLYWFGPQSVGRLLVASQVVLSLQLPFALWPLLRFNGRPDLMGAFALTRGWQLLAWAVFCAVTGANLWLVCMCLA
jgi:manganese transport protein